MRRLIKTRKGVALLATFVVVLAAAIGAYAYFTSSGSGTGTATAGSNTTGTDITVAGTTSATIVPGDGGQQVSFKASNAGPTGGLVTTVTLTAVDSTGACGTYLSTLSSSPPGGASAAGDGLADFSMTPYVISGGQVIAGHASNAALTGGTGGVLSWANQGWDQTPCAGQPLTLSLAWSSS